MRIVVNDIAASCGGAMTILKQFYNYVRIHDTENEWIFFLGDRYLEETAKIKVICFPEIKESRVRKVLFDCFYGRKVVESYQPDVVVSLQNIITFGVKAPQVLYIHQSIPFQNVKKFSFFKTNERQIAVIQYFIGAFIKESAKKANKVFVQTKWMKEAVLETTRISEDKVFVAFPDVELFEPDNLRFNPKRFFYPTSNELYKNIDAIIQACNILNHKGIHDFEVRLTLEEGIVEHKNINCIGRLDREQMQEEYQTGTLIFPSFIETVGLPLLEAKSCNTMILASDTLFSHECLDGYKNVKYFKYYDYVKLAYGMEVIINGTHNLYDISHSEKKNNDWELFMKAITSKEDEMLWI